MNSMKPATCGYYLQTWYHIENYRSLNPSVLTTQIQIKVLFEYYVRSYVSIPY